MDKTDFTKLVKSKSERVKLVNYEVGESDVWASFVKLHLNDKFANNVKCNTCSAVCLSSRTDIAVLNNSLSSFDNWTFLLKYLLVSLVL